MRSLRASELLSLATGLVTDWRLLKRTPHLSRNEMQAWQFKRLRQLVRHAHQHIPYYRELYHSISFEPEDLRTWDDFRKLPVVRKDDVVAHYPDRMLQAGSDMDTLIISRSSGSSGKVLDIAYDCEAMVTYVLAGLRLYQMCFDYRPWHKQLYVYTSPYPLNSLFGLYPLHFLHTLTPTHQILAALRTVKPDLLVIYPSILKQVTQVSTDTDRAVCRLKAISVNSEMSTQVERDTIARAFGCPVLDEYSSEELTRIAAQCRHKTYHVFEDINYLEILDDNGNPSDGLGTVVGTNLHNFAMPMIRYQQDDLAHLQESHCACGWRFRALTDLQGRRNDSFVMPSGKVLSSGFLLDATYEFLLTYRTAVRDFCLIQDTRTAVTLQIVRGDGWTEPVGKKIVERLQSLFEPGVVVRVHLVAECMKTKSGKRNPIISLVGRQGQ
jgi:phenylacetate-CoA ligase